jgi:hypothetical protein
MAKDSPVESFLVRTTSQGRVVAAPLLEILYLYAQGLGEQICNLKAVLLEHRYCTCTQEISILAWPYASIPSFSSRFLLSLCVYPQA